MASNRAVDTVRDAFHWALLASTITPATQGGLMLAAVTMPVAYMRTGNETTRCEDACVLLLLVWVGVLWFGVVMQACMACTCRQCYRSWRHGLWDASWSLDASVSRVRVVTGRPIVPTCVCL